MKKTVLLALSVGFALLFRLGVKKRQIYDIEKKQIALVAAAVAVICITVYYFTGLGFGFHRVALSWSNILRYIIPYAIVIICMEIVREVVLAQEQKLLNALFYICFVVLDVLLFAHVKDFGHYDGVTKAVSMILFPSISANLMYMGFTSKYGKMPNIVYRLVLAVYPFAIPFAPNMPDAMLALLKVLMPMFIFFGISKIYEKRKPLKHVKFTWVKGAGLGVILSFVVVVAMLVSCQFKYGMLVIGSESMTGAIDKGDAVIYKTYEQETIEEEQIILFKKSNILVIHRVKDIEVVNGVTRYYTQGDANDTLDSGYITANDIVGTSVLRIKYVGYPTVWLHELFNK